MTKTAAITEVTRPDGGYVGAWAEFLLRKRASVHGVRRRKSLFNTARFDHLYADARELEGKLVLHCGDMSGSSSLVRTASQARPDEAFNLAARSHVAGLSKSKMTRTLARITLAEVGANPLVRRRLTGQSLAASCVADAVFSRP